MSESQNIIYEKLVAHVRETAVLESIAAVLGWDERTNMPPAGGEFRAEQISYLSGVVHRRQTDPQLGDWLGELAESPLAADPHSDSGTTIRQIKRTFDKSVKLPQSLVEEISKVSVLGQQKWVEARKNNDFASFRPLLERVVHLKRQQAEAIGYDDCLYDALLDDFEPNEKTANVARVLEELRQDLVPLVAAIADSPWKPNAEILARSYPINIQESFGRLAAAKIGFDFDRGRLDVTQHPFCTDLGPNDIRILTRYKEHDFGDSFYSILHEAGHGMYEQGLRHDVFGLPPGRYASMGIHESQSRMWENAVGRSHSFWQYFFSQAQEAFPTALGDVSLDDFHFAVNDVRPSLIRTESDEATYNLHIIIRFELEQALLGDDLPVADLPSAWREKYQTCLGIEPPDDSDGVLQDVHWSAALFGYFPTYSLGNLYAAQFFAQADQDLGGLDEQFARGEFEPLKTWLNTSIHQRGQCYSAAELAERVTGQPLSHKPLIDYLRNKLGPLYGI